MALNKSEFKQFLRDFNFRQLFVEMGWNNDAATAPVTVGSDAFAIKSVAEKSGFKILVCSPPDDGHIPDSATRKKLETKVMRLFQEHLIIFHNAAKTEQIWQWVARQSGKPARVTETRWNTGQEPELLFQRASGVFFELDEEDNITIVDVTQRVAENFDQNNERVTKRFYDAFKKQHTSFSSYVKGIDDYLNDKDNPNKQWYVSLMLNRLMFCYFIQKKNFLDRDKDYLRNKLAESKAKRGTDKYYSFYRDFLLALFHSGLGSPTHDADLTAEIGCIPYLNGGLFDEHELERLFENIEIGDEAFEKIFDFFDQYEWHLDTRHAASGKDINPDVIGYIFEKYINDRADMGAYYTKEDITDYISKNCILPFLFDETKRNYPKAFTASGEIWSMLRASGDKYVYDAVKHGLSVDIRFSEREEEHFLEEPRPLPENIAIGLDTTKPDLLERRKDWNRTAPETHALPTEIWREVVDRRRRYGEAKAKIESGGITAINDLITYNLNIRQFAQDVVENTNDPKFLEHFYKALNSVTILDPTCGSGAFLFAAMNILEPLYESCLQRMRNFIEDEDRTNLEDQKTFGHKFPYFRDVLLDVQSPAHPNLQYFIYKSIILRNLYGVDIMNEAVEVAKLRLFLKLVATVEADYKKPNLGLEPLPDVDFNIRPGNSLIGFVSQNQIETLNALLITQQEKEKVLLECDVVARAFGRFKENQLKLVEDFAGFKKAKDQLNERLDVLTKMLDKTLFKQHYEGQDYNKWEKSHQPFHWLAEFFGIIVERGGFDVIVGNPPYVEFADVDYSINGYETESCGNLYAFVLERTSLILAENGFCGMIVPLSGHSTDRMRPLVEKFYNDYKLKYLFNISADANPSRLFPDVKFRLSIFFVTNAGSGIFSTKYKRWYAEERERLFETINYDTFEGFHYKSVLPKISDKRHLNILNNLVSTDVNFTFDRGNFRTLYHNAPVNWIRAHSFVPYFCSERDGEGVSTQLKVLSFETSDNATAATAAICSSLFYLWWVTISDCYHLNKPELLNFPLKIRDVELVGALSLIEDQLREDMLSKSVRRVYHYRTSGRV